jgi:hypothetical protein
MSTPVRSCSSTPLQPTRQQLDELIELMQRMLSLPESAPEQDAAPLYQRGVRLPQSVSAAASTFAEPADNHVEVASAAAATPALRSELSGGTPQSTSPVAESVAVMSVSLLPVSSQDPAKILEAEEPQRAGNREQGTEDRQKPLWLRLLSPVAHLGLWPLLRIDWVFEGCMSWLGAPGSWLTGPCGRAWLGWSGLTLLAAALAGYLLVGMGWTW